MAGSTSNPVVDSYSSSAVTAAPGAETRVSLVVNGVPETDAVPGGESIPADSQVLLIPNVFPVAVDADGVNAIARRSQVEPGKVKPAQRTLTAGEIYFRQSNGSVVDTGLHLAHNEITAASGSVYAHYVLAYPPSGTVRNVTLFVEGPVHVGAGPVLDVSGEVDFSFQISNNGFLGPGKQSTYPTGAVYALPSDGTTLYQAFMQLLLARLNTTLAVPATMTLTWPAEVKTETRNTNGGSVTILDALNDPGDPIPANGIDTVVLSIQAPTP